MHASGQPLLIAGDSFIAELVDLVADWRRARGDEPGNVRLLLGSEPFRSQRPHFASAREEFTEEVRGYWLEQSISVRLSAKVIRVIQELDSGSLQVRAIPGPPHLHAKIYVGDDASTVGSSNFTDYGLVRQLEANARFERAGEPYRYDELVVVAENFWAKGSPWEDEFRLLLLALLQVVTWKEALARACAELLEGDWARSVLSHQEQRAPLWPSQRTGIAQALWVVENLGSVLVADATGSGKTRMGAHLVAAVRDRLIDTGRLRRDRDLTTLGCPPAVQETWQREALISGVTVMPVSHGLLSRPDADNPRIELAQVARAQVLAVDEAHNFLSLVSRRTQHVRDSLADHVLLFTATPISRGAEDLLSLVGLLGADNFDDGMLEILEKLDRGARSDEALTGRQRELIRGEIQRFTVRRTKTALNQLVAQDEDAYRHHDTGRVCRYPAHQPYTYATGETESDDAAAWEIQEASSELLGIVQLGRIVRVPNALRHDFSDQQWLDSRLHSTRGIARHHVRAAMRSSRAALIEHVAGTAEAIRECAGPAAPCNCTPSNVTSRSPASPASARAAATPRQHHLQQYAPATRRTARSHEPPRPGDKQAPASTRRAGPPPGRILQAVTRFPHTYTPPARPGAADFRKPVGEVHRILTHIGDRGAADFRETVAGEEVHRESQAECPRYAYCSGLVQKLVIDQVADPMTGAGWRPRRPSGCRPGLPT